MHLDHPKTMPLSPGPWKICLPQSQSLGSKMLGTTAIQHIHMAGKLVQLKCLNIEILLTVGHSTGLLECPHDVVADFPKARDPIDQGRSCNVFMTHM